MGSYAGACVVIPDSYDSYRLRSIIRQFAQAGDCRSLFALHEFDGYRQMLLYNAVYTLLYFGNLFICRRYAWEDILLYCGCSVEVGLNFPFIVNFAV